MHRSLVRKLSRFTSLSDEDVDALKSLFGGPRRRCSGREDLLVEGDRPRNVHVVVDGWACRYKYLPDGRRQVISLFLPGDMCEFNACLLRAMDHSIGALTPVTFAELPHDGLSALFESHPRLLKAIWCDTLVGSSIQREWTVNLGQRTAPERLGHLLCEVYVRLGAIGQVTGNSCPFPLTQCDVADAIGVSNVHVNRTLRELRESGLVGLASRRLVVPDIDALMRASLFNPNYLHLDREGASRDAGDRWEQDAWPCRLR